MKTGTSAWDGTDDAELVSQSLAGSGDAFGEIVRRYQSLICSLAYSATGSVSSSEDVAQETFVAAWRQLGKLREPAKLRSWLCGIARNLIADAMRLSGREPTFAAETMETIEIAPAPPELVPAQQAVSREEEAILWRAVERIPEIYREPLILFYRQQHSVARVAEALELSEDVVKQRLSRGRKMLQEKVTAFVEGTLARTNPAEGFTSSVLAALPITGAAVKVAASGAAAAKGGASVKAAGLGWLGVFLAPVLGITAGLVGTRLRIQSARSDRERRWAVRWAWLNWGTMGVFYLVFSLVMALFGSGAASASWTRAVVAGSFAVTLGFVAFNVWSFRRQIRIRAEDGIAGNPRPSAGGMDAPAWEYRSRATLFGLPLLHVRRGWWENGKIQPARGWIAFGDVAHGILFACGSRSIGLISVGGLAIGVVASGGCAIGGLAVGGLAAGGWAIGGAAVGYLASGATALGWVGAVGGAAMAREFADGGVSWAQHANDAIASQAADGRFFFRHVVFLMNAGVLLSIVPFFCRGWAVKLAAMRKSADRSAERIG